MKFRYKRYGPGILRPVIPIRIRSRSRSVDYEVLVDSGADSCIFDAQIADILGIDLADGERRIVAGITGVQKPYVVHPVTIEVGGRVFETVAGFLPDMPPLGYGVVGQQGFFEHFIVRFDLARGEIELEARTS